MASEFMIDLTAEDVVKRYGFDCFPIDPFVIAQGEGIFVDKKPDEISGASGHLLRMGDKYFILYSTAIENEGFQRFSIAHELGHYFLEGHIDQLLINNSHESRANFQSEDPLEREADRFAAALLMPRSLFEAEMKRQPEGLKGVSALHRVCKTSLTATAIRYATLASIPVAVVFTDNGRVDSAFMSPSFKALPNLTYLRKKSPIPRSITRDERQLQPGEIKAGTSTLEDWFDGRAGRRLSEEVTLLGNGKRLTVLKAFDYANDEEEDADDEEQVDRYGRKYTRWGRRD